MGERKVLMDSNNKIYLEMIEAGYSLEDIKEMQLKFYCQN